MPNIGVSDLLELNMLRPLWGERVLLPAQHNIRLAVLTTWSRARIEATSRLPEAICNPMELVPRSLDISRKHPHRRDRLRLHRVRIEE
jgi:hypothetical protein